MTGAQKFSISLLVSVLVISVLAVLVAVDRFRVIETRFYVPRVEEGARGRALMISEAFEAFHRGNIARFREFTLEPSVTTAFRVNASAAQIRERGVRLDAMKFDQIGLDVVRIISLDGSELHYSSDARDYTQTATQRTYLRPDQISARADEAAALETLAYYRAIPEGGLPSGDSLPDPDVTVGAATQQFVYRLAAVDATGVLQGAALFYVNLREIRSTLIRRGLIGTGEEIRLLATSGVLVNARSPVVDELSGIVAQEWLRVVDGAARTTVTDSGGADDEPTFSYEIFTSPSEFHGPYAYAEPSSSLEMARALQYTLIGAVFITIFLLVFLFLNVRQDPVTVLSDRVKRFQILLLREYMENKEDLDFQRWRAELEERRAEVGQQIRAGIGRVRPEESAKIDAMIDQSWDEIIQVLGRRAPERSPQAIDVDRIEEIINQLSRRLTTGQIQQVAHHPPTEQVEPRPVEVEEVEDLEDDDVTEMDELDDEELEEIEEIEEIEASDAVNTVEPGLRGRPVEVEDLDDLDDEELEELDDAIEVDGLDEVDGPVDTDEVDLTDEVAELESVEVPSELDELDELDSDDERDSDDTLEQIEDEVLDDVDDEELEELDDEALDESVDQTELPAASETLEVRPAETHDGALHDGVTLDSLDELTELEWMVTRYGAAGAGDTSRTISSFPSPQAPESATVEELDEPDDLEDLEDANELVEIDDLDEFDEVDEPATGPFDEEFEDEEAVEAEEIPQSAHSATTFGAAFFAFSRGTEAWVPRALQQPDFTASLDALEVADVGEGESVEDAEPGARTSGGLIRIDHDRSIATDEYEIATVAEVLSRFRITHSILTESDGLVEIGATAFAESHRTDASVRSLVADVTGESIAEERSGVEELFGASGEDLLADLRSDQPHRPSSEDGIGVSVFRFAEGGFDYDGFLRGFRRTEAGVLKSIVTFTHYWNARTGAILIEREGELRPSYSLGLSDECESNLVISRSSSLYRNIVAKRRILFLARPLAEVEYFHDLCDPEHFGYFETSLLVPVVLRGESGYFLLGFPRSITSMDEAFDAVVPRLSEDAAVRV